MLTAGIDIGSSGTKAVLLQDGRLRASAVIHTLADSVESSSTVYALLLQKAGCEAKEVDYVVATGYGRVNVEFADRVITEITCHARGLHEVCPNVRTVLDMGGQDCKVIHLDKDGFVEDFIMNNRCAAGTGRYLERISKTLQVPLEELGPRSLAIVDKPAPVSSFCTVFAEGDAILQVRRGAAINDVLAGISDSLAERTARLVKSLGVIPDMAVTGGIAKNCGITQRLETLLETPIIIPPEPQLTGALGAALLAAEKSGRRQRRRHFAQAAQEE